MKNKFTLLIIAMAIMFGCAKEEPQTTLEPSEFIDEYAGYFVKDLLVYDENNVNSAYFRVYSEDENALNKFLEYNTLVLEVMSQDEGNSLLEAKNDIFSKEAAKAHGKREDLNPENYDLDGPIVNIELITENLVDESSFFKVKLAPRDQIKNWHHTHYGRSVRWVSQSPHDFIGLVGFLKDSNPDDPFPVWPQPIYLPLVYPQYRNSGFFARWISWEPDNPCFLWYYIWQKNDFNKFRIGMLVHLHINDPRDHNDSYYVAYQTDNFRGRNCSLGAFDGRNCYVATAPAGTTPFYSPNNTGHLYHTPLPGNQCPLPGSHFDSLNCWVAQIPNGTYGFIIGQNLYVKPDKIFVP